MMLNFLKKIGRQALGEEGALFTHRLRSRLAAFFYRYPGRKLTVIGVTGTNGKTTTCFMIREILEAAGYRTGMATTVEFSVAEKRMVNTTKMTTVSPFALQRLLSQMVQAGCQYAIIETTSHAIKQERIFGIPYHTVVFTNLTHDHLDYHKSFEDYRTTKIQLFAHHPHLSIVNLDDKSAPHFLKMPADKKLTFGFRREADVRAERIKYLVNASSFRLITPAGSVDLPLPLPGAFNIANALAACAVGIGLNIPLPTILHGLSRLPGVPGRMERVEQGQPFRVIIDYAHSPDAFRQIYSTIEPTVAGNRIIHVFGATGDRDKLKRPILGAIAAKFADYVIVTDEDPYSEDPWKIIGAVADGVLRAGRSTHDRKKEGQDFWKILDRRQAIAKAFSLAKRGDIVLLTGKGAEQVMVVGNRKIPWDERQVAREELVKLGYKG